MNKTKIDVAKITKKIRKKQVTRIVPDKKYFTFYEALKMYFNTHHMPPVQLEMFEKDSYFSLNSDVKVCDKVIKLYDEDICNITFLPHRKGIELYRFEMYKTGKGFGSIFMNAFNEISKEIGVDIYLIPGDPGFNRNGDAQLRRNFYHKHNFKRTKDSIFWKNNF